MSLTQYRGSEREEAGSDQALPKSRWRIVETSGLFRTTGKLLEFKWSTQQTRLACLHCLCVLFIQPSHPVVCQNSADRLSGPPFVVVEDSTQSFMADDGGIYVDHARQFLDQPIFEPLMIPLKVLVLRELLHCFSSLPLP